MLTTMAGAIDDEGSGSGELSMRTDESQGGQQRRVVDTGCGGESLMRTDVSRGGKLSTRAD
jgi:hypothetical protein